MTIRNLSAVILLFAAALFLPGTVHAVERILDYQSRIEVNPDSTLTVTETIRVRAEGDQIRRGIFRDFPTEYKDNLGNRVRVDFDVREVTRNGRPEPWFTKGMPNGVRLYMGDKDTFIKPGEHVYSFTYSTSRQIAYYDDFDELYWNVTGNGWDFAIDRAEAVLVLPPGAEIMRTRGYTGRQGSTGSDFNAGRDSQGNLKISASRMLRPREGLTFAAAWPKGFVDQPTPGEQAEMFMEDNSTASSAFLGLVVVLVYYVLAWLRIGRDPKKTAIIPRFEPPKGFSPAATRFVMRMGFDHKAFASAIVNMAVKGYLTIREHDGEYALEKTNWDAALSKGERDAADNLFRLSDSVALKQRNHEAIGDSLNALKNSLRGEFMKAYFAKNTAWLVPGWLFTILTLLAVAYGARTDGDMAAAFFFTFWLTGWTAGCYGIALKVIRQWKIKRGVKKIGALAMTGFALPFFIGEFVGLTIYSDIVGFGAVALTLALALTNIIFAHLIKAPTTTGRRVMDHIEGFKMYMSVAEKHRMEAMHPPELTPKEFERLLPYALALDVEHLWSERFSETLRAAGEMDGKGYSPVWYVGRSSWHAIGATGFSTEIGSSLSSAISSSSTPPGSKGGSGGFSSGGGFSGGGGGGGGGGGW